ncbi:MAG: hypothetical protein WCT31_01010 [Candidatus Micrarchaeia archaeon]
MTHATRTSVELTPKHTRWQRFKDRVSDFIPIHPFRSLPVLLFAGFFAFQGARFARAQQSENPEEQTCVPFAEIVQNIKRACLADSSIADSTNAQLSIFNSDKLASWLAYENLPKSERRSIQIMGSGFEGDGRFAKQIESTLSVLEFIPTSIPGIPNWRDYVERIIRRVAQAGPDFGMCNLGPQGFLEDHPDDGGDPIFYVCRNSYLLDYFPFLFVHESTHNFLETYVSKGNSQREYAASELLALAITIRFFNDLRNYAAAVNGYLPEEISSAMRNHEWFENKHRLLVCFDMKLFTGDNGL